MAHAPTCASLIYTRDEGHHSSGWFANPDYERCLHLSIGDADYEAVSRELGRELRHVLGEPSQVHRDAWVRSLFREHVRLLWAEPPMSPEGKQRNVWHFRLFVADDWRTAILPRGEVYTRRFTELGWRSASEVLNAEQAVNGERIAIT